MGFLLLKNLPQAVQKGFQIEIGHRTEIPVCAAADQLAHHCEGSGTVKVIGRFACEHSGFLALGGEKNKPALGVILRFPKL